MSVLFCAFIDATTVFSEDSLTRVQAELKQANESLERRDAEHLQQLGQLTGRLAQLESRKDELQQELESANGRLEQLVDKLSEVQTQITAVRLR